MSKWVKIVQITYYTFTSTKYKSNYPLLISNILVFSSSEDRSGKIFHFLYWALITNFLTIGKRNPTKTQKKIGQEKTKKKA